MGSRSSERQNTTLSRSLQGLRSNYLLVTGAVVAGTAALTGAVLTAKSFVNAASGIEQGNRRPHRGVGP